MSYATKKDIEKRFNKAINSEKYHILISIIDDNGELVCNAYGQGICDADVIQVFRIKK